MKAKKIYFTAWHEHNNPSAPGNFSSRRHASYYAALAEYIQLATDNSVTWTRYYLIAVEIGQAEPSDEHLVNLIKANDSKVLMRGERP